MKPSTVNNMTFTQPKSQAKLKVILRICKQGATRQIIELAIGVRRRTVNSYITFLRETGQLHIASWTREGLGQFYPIPVYQAGAGQDAPKPGPLTERERQVRAWAKLKADPERYAKHRKAKRKRPEKTATPSVFDWRGQPSMFREGRV